VDKREYADCGLTCLGEPGTKKIPVRWSGAFKGLREQGQSVDEYLLAHTQSLSRKNITLNL
jgi:hypothetical protein